MVENHEFKIFYNIGYDTLVKKNFFMKFYQVTFLIS